MNSYYVLCIVNSNLNFAKVFIKCISVCEYNELLFRVSDSIEHLYCNQ